MQYYDGIAKGYAELHGEEQMRKIELIGNSLEPLPEEWLLDVGCGSGAAFDFMECRYVGLDPSLELLKQAHGPVVRGVAEKLPFKDDVFDIVICVSAFHNFEDPEKALDEMKRVCKGRIVVTVFKKGSDRKKVDNLVGIIEDKTDVQMVLEDEHDFIFFCNNL